MHACIGEGNGNPLQYSCLENPRDGGARWAATYGVSQSWTRLKQCSSSRGRHNLHDPQEVKEERECREEEGDERRKKRERWGEVEEEVFGAF